LQAIVTVMASRAAMEYQKRQQVELFAFADEPDVAVEDHRTVLTFAAERQVEEDAPISFDDEVSRLNVAQVFISDIMDVCRQADVGGSVPSVVVHHDILSMSSYVKPRVEACRASIDSSSSPSSKDSNCYGKVNQFHIISANGGIRLAMMRTMLEE